MISEHPCDQLSHTQVQGSFWAFLACWTQRRSCRKSTSALCSR